MSIRDDLFDSAKQGDLVNPLDVLVERRNSASRPAVWKLADDICVLAGCIRGKKIYLEPS